MILHGLVAWKSSVFLGLWNQTAQKWHETWVWLKIVDALLQFIFCQVDKMIKYLIELVDSSTDGKTYRRKQTQKNRHSTNHQTQSITCSCKPYNMMQMKNTLYGPCAARSYPMPSMKGSLRSAMSTGFRGVVPNGFCCFGGVLLFVWLLPEAAC